MGCASSTPMVATAGSEMLKAATHVVEDVKQQGEAVVEDATQALTTKLEGAKESVGNAVAGISSELGNAIKEGADGLEEAKHKVLEGLHLESKEDQPLSNSRAPTPALAADADSLKTSTPEPEIERALANEEEAPATPKPTLQELAELKPNEAAADAAAAAAAEVASIAAANADSSRWYRRAEQTEAERPSTTEWEKLADQLAKSRKFKPYESFIHSQNQFSVYKDYTSLRDKPLHYDGHFSDGSTSHSQSDLSSGQPTPAAPRRHAEREYAKFVAAEQAASVSRSSSRLSQSRTFDFNTQRERVNLPRRNSRVDSALTRKSLWAREQPAVLEEAPPSSSGSLRRNVRRGSVQKALQSPQLPLLKSERAREFSAQGKSRRSSEPVQRNLEYIKAEELTRHSPGRQQGSLDGELSAAQLLATPIAVATLFNGQANNEHKPLTTLAKRTANFIAAERSSAKPATPLHNARPTTTAAQANNNNSPVAAVAESRLASASSSSSSSSEVVIHPLSHLNTPSAISMSPDPVMMTAYADADLEAALARLADWRGSSSTLQSLRPSSQALRQSPWLRSQKEQHNNNNNNSNSNSNSFKDYQRAVYSSCASPACAARATTTAMKSAKLLERCEICCEEFVMN
ncbi:CG14837 [Drosophila busckii]|uniref:CG14837 n=1 Tax=Drosophila busckii TaxID=30019 RepID=A0A0M4EN62_DROBS|nr:CG14837 [Drosophila busckii]